MSFKFSKRDKSIVDVLFLLALFATFLICALFIVLFGARIYKKTVFKNKQFFNARTSVSYITEKIRQNDNSNGIQLIDDSNSSVLVLTTNANNIDYSTYIFCKDGMLMEYTANSDVPYSNTMGRKIMNAKSFDIMKISDKLYGFTVCDDTDYKCRFFVSVNSDNKEASINEK